jgi:hypothetical protein
LIFGLQGGHMPMVVRPPGPHRTAVPRSGDESNVGDHPPLDGLLPSSGLPVPAPAPAPHRALALDALRLRRGLRDNRRRPAGWGDAAFAREVELVRCHLAPLRNRWSLAASFGREAFQTLDVARSRPAMLGPIRAAYAIRWLELGTGASLPAWSSLLTMEPPTG